MLPSFSVERYANTSTAFAFVFISPIQYPWKVLGSCCTKSRLEKFSEMSSSFGQSAFAPDYDPWTYVDGFGRSAIYKTFVSSYRSVLSGSEFHFRSPGFADTSSVRDAPAVKLPSDSKRRRMERSCSRSRASSVAEESPADVSKN